MCYGKYITFIHSFCRFSFQGRCLGPFTEIASAIYQVLVSLRRFREGTNEVYTYSMKHKQVCLRSDRHVEFVPVLSCHAPISSVHYSHLRRRTAHRHPRKTFSPFFAGFAFGLLSSPQDTDYLGDTGKLGCIIWSQPCQSNSYKRNDYYTRSCEGHFKYF